MVIGFEREPPWLDSIQPYLSLPPSLPVNSRIYFVLSRVPAFPIICRSSFIILSTGGAGKCWKIIASQPPTMMIAKTRKFDRFKQILLHDSSKVFIYLFIFSPLVNIYELLINKYPEIWNYNSLNFLYFFFFSVGTHNRFDRNRGNYILNCAKNKETHE